MMASEFDKRDRPEEELVFERLFKSQFRNLYVHAFAMVKEEAAAKEIVQQVFFKLWKRKELLSNDISLNAYLYRAVYNESINHLKRIRSWSSHNKARQQFMNDTVSSAEKSGVRDLQKAIAEVLQELPDKCRIVFQMSRYEELKYGEIADKLGISVKAVEKHITKALKIFRVKLKDYLPLFFLLWLHR
ncbi:MAG: RNA polymerase sigma-70 factor [Citrobacter freundii]|nr:MAG: RNA polymerase sigma-70 factor [Citrobacter freundii]